MQAGTHSFKVGRTAPADCPPQGTGPGPLGWAGLSRLLPDKLLTRLTAKVSARVSACLRAVLFVCLLIGLAVGLLCGPAQARGPLLPQGQGVVAHNFDGDTLKLTDRRVVRLAGIDSPELGSGKNPPQYHARQSRDLLNRLARGQRVSLHMAGEEGKDRYGRLTAEVLLEDGRSLNEIMVREGAAFVYPHKGQDPELLERLLDLQREAIQQRRGLWEHLLSLPVARQTYLGNRNSQRFFPADCAEAQRIKPRNRVYFGTLMDAFLLGHAPARVCPFWPTED